MVVETSGSGHEVLAMGCRAQQRMGAVEGEAGDGKSGRGLIVVLDGGGADLEEQGRVLEAMERFSPCVLVWVYEEGANPPMRGLVGKGGKLAGYSGRAGIGSAAEKAEDGESQERPRLRLAGGGNDRSASGDGLTASDVLDGDELAALLKPNT